MQKRERFKVVLDSTVLVSAFITDKGLSSELLKRCEKDANLYTAEDILDETRRVLLEEEHIRTHYFYDDIKVEHFIQRLRVVSNLVSNLADLHVIERDSKDDKILACALASNADYIITRDAHLLDLKEYKGIKILKPEDFMKFLREAEQR